MLFSVLYGGDRDLVLFYVHASMQRLGAQWAPTAFDQDTARALFFLLLDKDMELKHATLAGLPALCIEPLAPRRAEAFFLALREEVLEPWLSDERLTRQDLVDRVANLYLVV
jgi:hypothetical protein